MTPAPTQYPWYTVVEGDDVLQGEILESCPLFSPTSVDLLNRPARAYFDWQERDVIVLSQSCDLQNGKVDHVILCSLWSVSDLAGSNLGTPKQLEDTRQGKLPAFHMLGACSIPSFDREVRIVEFHRIWSLPLASVRQHAATKPHLRLLPPYREQLSQSFARYFMRVGLPMDIPRFK